MGKRKIKTRSRRRRKRGKKRRASSATVPDDAETKHDNYDGAIQLFCCKKMQGSNFHENDDDAGPSTMQGNENGWTELESVNGGKAWNRPEANEVGTNRWISDMKAFPHKSLLAVSMHNCEVRIFAYKIENGGSAELTLVSKLTSSSSAVTHLDFGLPRSRSHTNHVHVRTNDESHEILRYKIDCSNTTITDLANKKSAPSRERNMTRKAEYKNTEWLSHTLPLEWATQGAWPAGEGATFINAVDASHGDNEVGSIIATADDDGNIKLYNYPCLGPNADCITMTGHSSHVMNVRFDNRDGRLFSVGGNDRTVFQWGLRRND